MTRAEQISALRRQGRSYTEIAEETGIPRPSVVRWAHKLGLRGRARPGGRSTTLDADIVDQLAAAGVTQREIGRRFDVSDRSVSAFMARRAIPSARARGLR